jgi:WD40 repeat protein
MADFLHDAKRFVLKNRQIADQAPLQIYCAGLVFAPRTSIIHTEFKADLPSWVCQLPQGYERWGAELQALEGHSGSVLSVAFSPNSRLLASSSLDNTVRLWDPATGALQQTLEGHSGSVLSVAFSPDGRLLASGSRDDTVRLWDTATGTLQQTLVGHSVLVSSVAFSPDGRLLASGSTDNTVWLWDPATGALQETLNTEGIVNKLEFSQEGSSLIANLGTLDFRSGREHHASHSTRRNLAIFIDQEWIKLYGNNVLWLPPDFRPSCFTINGDTVALGHASGRVSFLRFQL